MFLAIETKTNAYPTLWQVGRVYWLDGKNLTVQRMNISAGPIGTLLSKLTDYILHSPHQKIPSYMHYVFTKRFRILTSELGCLHA